MWIDGAVTSGEISILGVADMATKLEAAFAQTGDKIGELRIVGHGNAYGQFMGANWIEDRTAGTYAKDFRRIGKLFSAQRGVVTLGGCQVGQNGPLLLKLSEYFKVPVRAFTALQRPLVPGDEGNSTDCYVTCSTSKDASLWDWLDN